MIDEKPTIEQLEDILAGKSGDLSVEIKPDGSIHAYKKDEAREQGPVHILTHREFQQSHY